MASSTFKQYLRTKNEVEASLNNAKRLRDQWMAANTGANPDNLVKKDIDYIGKAFKNRLLTVKWDCEDLEELLRACEQSKNSDCPKDEILSGKCFVNECRGEITKLMEQLEENESVGKIFNKHGIATTTTTTTTTTTFPTSSSSTDLNDKASSMKYEKLLDLTTNLAEAEEVQFDKKQIESASIFNNALYDHLEQQEQHFKLFNSNNSPTQVFNNLSRPVTNVYMNPNENEIILDMLETEYYNPPSGLNKQTRFDYTIRKILETDRNKFIGTIAFLFSFPIIFVLIMIL